MYWVMAILPFVLLLLGFPIFLLLLATSLVILTGFFDLPMTAVHQNVFNSLNKYALLAVPFFIFAGDLMSRGGLTERSVALGRVNDRRIPRTYSIDVARFCGAVRRNIRRDDCWNGGGWHADLSAHARGRL